MTSTSSGPAMADLGGSAREGAPMSTRNRRPNRRPRRMGDRACGAQLFRQGSQGPHPGAGSAATPIGGKQGRPRRAGLRDLGPQGLEGRILEAASRGSTRVRQGVRGGVHIYVRDQEGGLEISEGGSGGVGIYDPRGPRGACHVGGAARYGAAPAARLEFQYGGQSGACRACCACPVPCLSVWLPQVSLVQF